MTEPGAVSDDHTDLAEGRSAELVVFGHRDLALHAGFRSDGSHTQYPHIRAWWPGRGKADIAARRFERVTVDRSARGVCASELSFIRAGQQVFSDPIWLAL